MPRSVPAIPVFCLLAVIGTLLASFPAARGAKPAPVIPEIAEASALLDRLEDRTNARLTERRAKYLADLRTLEPAVAAATGSLDQALIVRKELDAWTAGNPTPAIDPKDDAFPLELRKLRYYFDKDYVEIEKTAAAAREDILPEVIASLKNAEAVLARAARVDDALAARRKGEILAEELKRLRAAKEPPRTSSLLADEEGILVSPNGAGKPVTLDEALAEAKEGDTLILAKGTYPPAKESKDENGLPAYRLETRGLRIIGDRAVLPGEILILADDIAISGLRTDRMCQVGPGRKVKGVTVRNCRYDRLSIREGSQVTVENSVGAVKLEPGGECRFDHCTLLFPTAEMRKAGTFALFQGSASHFENCIFRGGENLFLTYYNGPKECVIRNSLIHSEKNVLTISATAGKPAQAFEDPAKLRDFNIKATGLIVADPLFVNLEKSDYRLQPGSPAKGKSRDDRDLGAALDASGWPVDPDSL